MLSLQELHKELAVGCRASRAPITAKGRRAPARGTRGTEVGQAPGGDQRDRRGARHGDLKENAEYHARARAAGLHRGPDQAPEAELSHAQVIDVGTLAAGDKIVFGATVELADADSGEEDLPDRRRPRGRHQAGLIAISSPVAARADRQVRGRQHQHPGARRHARYEILSVRYLG